MIRPYLEVQVHRLRHDTQTLQQYDPHSAATMETYILFLN